MTRRPITRAHVEWILELGNSSTPVDEIARLVRVPASVVKLWLERGSLHGSPDWDHGDLHAPWREAVGVDEQTLRPKYGPEYQPLSARTGRETAQETAMRAFSETIDGIPVKGYTAPGLWDPERERAEGPRRTGHEGMARTQRDYEAAQMARYVVEHSEAMSTRLLEIYRMFWVLGMSRGQIGTRLGCKAERIHEAVKLLRRRMRDAERGAK